MPLKKSKPTKTGSTSRTTKKPATKKKTIDLSFKGFPPTASLKSGCWKTDEYGLYFCPVDKKEATTESHGAIRKFESGATRNCDKNKNDYEGFFSPLFLEAFGDYMHSHRIQGDGEMRASDNWQKGIEQSVYVKSLWRHFFDLWKIHRGLKTVSPEDGHEITAEEACCAMMFNVQGYCHEALKKKLQS